MNLRTALISSISLGLILVLAFYGIANQKQSSPVDSGLYSGIGQTSLASDESKAKIATLSAEIERYGEEINSLKLEIAKLSTALRSISSAKSIERPKNATSRLESSSEAGFNNTPGLSNIPDKTAIREFVLDALEDTVLNQQSDIRNQQLEQDEIKKLSLNDPDHTQQYKTDRMAEKLELSDAQKEAYHQLIDSYSKSNEESNQQIAQDFIANGDDPEQIQAHFTEQLLQEEDLNTQLEEDFIALLDQTQEHRYRNLPRNEKNILGNRFSSEADFIE